MACSYWTTSQITIYSESQKQGNFVRGNRWYIIVVSYNVDSYGSNRQYVGIGSGNGFALHSPLAEPDVTQFIFNYE